MREQEMRERVQQFLRTALLPAALGVGVGLTSACRSSAHTSADSGPAVSTEPGSPRGSRGDGAIGGASSNSHAAAGQPDARTQGPGLKVDPGTAERRLQKARAIYSAAHPGTRDPF